LTARKIQKERVAIVYLGIRDCNPRISPLLYES